MDTRRPTLRARPVHSEQTRSRSTTTRASTRTTSTSRRSRARSRKATGSAATSSSPPTTPSSPGLYVYRGLRAGARQEPDPQHRQPDRRAAEPALRPRPGVLAAMAPGMTGIAWNEEITGGPVTSIEQLLTDPKLKGKVTMLEEMADTVGLVLLDNGDDPAKSRTRRSIARSDVQAARRLGPDPEVHGQRLRAAARQGRFRGLRRLVRRRRPARSSRTRTSNGRSRRRAGSSGPTTCSSRSAGASRRLRRT